MPEQTSKSKTAAKLREQQIIEAAREIFIAKGFASATTAEIAERAGVAEGTIYNYFASKRELFIAVIKDLIITPPLLDIIGKLDGKDITANFQSLLLDRLQLIDQRPLSQMPALMGEVMRDPELKALWKDSFLHPFLDQLSTMHRFMQASGTFQRMKTEVAVRVMAGMVLGFILIRLMEADDSPLDKMPQHEIAEEMARFISYGLLTRKEEEAS